jgi:ATP-dependent DNA helicase RecG
MSGSKINPLLTIEYLTTKPENKNFDRKSAQIKPKDLAQLITAFANAEGGTVAIGITDKTMRIEGINSIGEDRINDLINTPKDCCRPMPNYEPEFLNVENEHGKQDRVLLIHVICSPDQVIRTSADKTYLRIGDKTQEMLGDNLRNLEYTKGARHFEDECNEDAIIEDLDDQLIQKYKESIGAPDVDTKQVLKARGFIKRRNDKEYLTNAAVLLFAKNIQSFYSNCRLRFVRYNGSQLQVGSEINITKDYSIEGPIPYIIEESKRFISTQLREFTFFNRDGRFENIPEYPEFAWLEGIVNAVTHRDYAMQGSYILVSMYDNRLEIESPGGLPNIVTVENILTTRYSRNPKISRVLTDLGWVRELNEGVKRIFSDMKKFFLDEPRYMNRDSKVTLILFNNIVMRTLRQKKLAMSHVGIENWNKLDDLEKSILTYIINQGPAKKSQLVAYTGKSGGTVNTRLNHLIECNFIEPNGNKSSPNRTYEAVIRKQ